MGNRLVKTLMRALSDCLQHNTSGVAVSATFQQGGQVSLSGLLGVPSALSCLSLPALLLKHVEKCIPVVEAGRGGSRALDLESTPALPHSSPSCLGPALGFGFSSGIRAS